MQLADIKPGMEIEYQYQYKKVRKGYLTRTGIVRQVTPRIIAVQGERYPDTILVNDLLSGQAKIINLKGEREMAKPRGRAKRETPPREELLSLYVRHEGKIERIRKELGCSWLNAKEFLVEAGIINSLGEPTGKYKFEWYSPKKKQTLPPEPVQAANQKPEREEEEPAEEIITEQEKGCSFDEPAYNPDVSVDGFTSADDEPIPHTLLFSKDTTEPDNEEMAKSDTVELEIEWPPKDPIERILLEATMNAHFVVKRVVTNPVALALIKRLIERGAV